MNSYWLVHTGSENHCDTTKSLKICYLFNTNHEGVYRIKISDVDELKSHINSEWADLSHTVIEYRMPFVSVISVYALAFVLKADILSTRCNKDDMM